MNQLEILICTTTIQWGDCSAREQQTYGQETMKSWLLTEEVRGSSPLSPTISIRLVNVTNNRISSYLINRGFGNIYNLLIIRKYKSFTWKDNKAALVETTPRKTEGRNLKVVLPVLAYIMYLTIGRQS